MSTTMEAAGLQCVTLRKLKKNITNSIIIGIIIRSQDVKLFSGKQDNDERGVWNFTLRDSITDYINVTCWGSGGYIKSLKEKFTIGDIIDIMKPKIIIRQIDDKGEKFRPSVTSPYNLTVNEELSSIIMHEGENYHTFLPLLHYPTKPAASFLTLADIHNNGATIRGDFVDLLVAVQFVGPVKKVKAKTDGRELSKRDVIVLDRTRIGLRITYWEEEFITRAEHWKPRDTILFLADMRVDWSNFEKCMVAVPNSKTIITEDPLIPQAEELREYARTVPIHPISVADQMAAKYPDPNTITTVMTCKRVIDIALAPKPNNIGPSASTSSSNDDQFTALLFAIVSDLDLDGFTQLVITRCNRCNQIINKTVNTCVNLECPVGSGSERGEPESQFNIKIMLSDHTGSLPNCRMVGKIAETILGVSAKDFLKMTDDEKCALKWVYLLERCEVRILVMKQENKLPIISILSCKLADIAEVAAKLPVY